VANHSVINQTDHLSKTSLPPDSFRMSCFLSGSSVGSQRSHNLGCLWWPVCAM